MLIDFQDKTTTQRYRLMAQTVIPRPIAWIVTESEGIVNIAPFSYFAPLSSEPPTMIVAIGHREDGTPKDTLRNLREIKKCVICMVDEAHLEAMDNSAESLAPEQSEAEVFEIDTVSMMQGYPPMVAGVKAAYFCEYLQEVSFEGSDTIPVIVKISHLYVDEQIVTDKEKLKIKLDAIGRVSRNYARMEDI